MAKATRNAKARKAGPAVAPAKEAQASVEASDRVDDHRAPADPADAGNGAGADGHGGGDAAEAEALNTQEKPPRSHDEPEALVDDRAGLPADSGAGDPHANTPRGSSGTAREAPGTDGGTTAATPDVGTQSGSPNNAEADALPCLEAWRALEGMSAEEAAWRFPHLSAALQGWIERAAAAEIVEAGPTIRIAALRDGFRRAGIAHPKEPADRPITVFTPDQVEQLLGEAMLKVELV